MSTKIRAKNPSNILQTLTCDSGGHLNVAFDGLDLSTTNDKLDLNFGKLSNIQTITDTKLSAIQTFLDKDSGNQFINNIVEEKLTEIEAKTYNRSRGQIKYENVSLAQNTASSVFNLSNYISTKCRLWGNSDIHKDIILQFSDDNNNWHNSENIHILNINSEYVFNLIIECPPKYMRVFNQNPAITINLYLELTF